MHGLVVPDDLSGRSPERHDRTAVVVQVRAAPEVVWRRIPGRHEDKVAPGINRHGRPHVWRAQGIARRTGVVRAGYEVGRGKVPAPAQRSGSRIPGPHHPARWIDAHIIGHRRSHNHQIVHDRRWRSHLILAPPQDIPNAGIQIDDALVAKVRARRTRGRVEGNQPGVVGSGEDTPPTGRPGRPVSVQPA